MGEKFKNKYNTGTVRLKGFDYGDGGYFVTRNREDYFGEIMGGEMRLNDCGRIVENEIMNIPKIRKNVEIDEFVVMPDHLHIILMINPDLEEINNPYQGNIINPYQGDVPAERLYQNYKGKNEYFSNISPKSGSLGNIIKMFKSYTTKIINKLPTNYHFIWHSNYYEHIIKNEDEYYRIKKYIIENPLNWELHKNNPKNIYM